MGLFQLSFSSGVPVHPASIRWVAQWYPSVHWVIQWHSSGIPVYTGPASVHWPRVRDMLKRWPFYMPSFPAMIFENDFSRHPFSVKWNHFLAIIYPCGNGQWFIPLRYRLLISRLKSFHQSDMRFIVIIYCTAICSVEFINIRKVIPYRFEKLLPVKCLSIRLC